MPSTLIHDPITKRVSRYNRSRDPYLTLPYLALGGPTTSLDPFFSLPKNVPSSGVGPISR